MENKQSVVLDRHLSRFMESLRKMKEAEVKTDVTLILLDKSRINCHKVVLMASSVFFQRMFQSEMKEGFEKSINLNFADPDTIRTIVDFFYTGIVPLTGDNVLSLIAACEFLACEHLKDHCEEYLVEHVECSNCVQLYTSKSSKMFHLEKLTRSAYEFLLQNFSAFLEMADFECLTEEELTDIVSKDELVCDNEDIVFDAVVHWVESDPDVREGIFPKIAHLIRFPYCSEEYLTRNVRQNALMLSSGCGKLAQEALSSQFFKCQNFVHNSRFNPRSNQTYKGKLVRMIKVESSDEFQISRASADNGTTSWSTVHSGIASNLFGFLASPQGLYFFNNDYYQFCDVRTQEVTTISTDKPPFKTDHHFSHSFTFSDDKIFHFGDSKPSKAVRSLNVKDDNPNWNPEPDMLHAIRHPSVVYFADKVFVFGGFGEGDRYSMITQEFDTVNKQWRMRKQMPGPNYGASVVAFNSKIYLVGGSEKTCYRYCPGKDEWDVLSPPIKCVNSLTSTVWMGKILLSNGRFVEEYDPVSDSWSVRKEMLPQSDVERIFLGYVH